MENPDRSCRIFMVRHGQTALNVEKRFRGTMDIPLNDQGVKDAWLAAERLKNQGVVAVYSSPLGRACEVARAIVATTGTESFDVVDGLTNLDYGHWHGLTKEECFERYPAQWRHYRELPHLASCPGGESLSDAADRVCDSLIDLGQAHEGEVIVAVTHGVIVRLAALRAIGAPRGDWEIPLDTGSATVFHVYDGQLEFNGAIDDFVPVAPVPVD